jgi:hypothetical protein
VKFKVVLAALALFALTSQKSSRAQELSGAYAIYWHSTCQIVTSGLATVKPGGSSDSVGTAVFAPSAANPNAGLADISETVVGGPPITAGTGTIVSRSQHSTLPYSISATTLTINGSRYDAVYADIRNGVARSVFFDGVRNEDTFANACAAIGSLRAVTE